MFLPRREVIESAAAQTPAAVAAIVLIPAPLAARPARPAESPIVGIMWAWPFRFWFARVSCPGLRFWNRSTWSPLLCTPHVYTYSYLLGTRLTRSLHARARARAPTHSRSFIARRGAQHLRARHPSTFHSEMPSECPPPWNLPHPLLHRFGDRTGLDKFEVQQRAARTGLQPSHFSRPHPCACAQAIAATDHPTPHGWAPAIRCPT